MGSALANSRLKNTIGAVVAILVMWIAPRFSRSDTSTTSVTSATTSAAKRTPLPDTTDREKALTRVKELLSAEYAAKGPAAQRALYQKLRALMKETKEPSDQFVLLTEALNQVVNLGDASAAIETADVLTATFEIPRSAFMVELLTKVSATCSTAPGHVQIVNQLAALLDEAVTAEDFNAGQTIADALKKASGRLTDGNIVKQVFAQIAAFTDAKREYAAVSKARATLTTQPADAESNAVAGRYACFVKGDWATGLSMLARGNDTALRALAEKDAAAGDNAAQAEALGNAWFDYAAKLDAKNKIGPQLRARYWLEKAVPSLTGLSKVVVEKRLETLPKSSGKNEPAKVDSKNELVVKMYVGEYETTLIDKDAPDVLTAKRNGNSISIEGTKKPNPNYLEGPPAYKVGTMAVNGKWCGHFGKVAILPTTLPAAGEITASIDARDDHTFYYVMLVKKDGSVDRYGFALTTNDKYTWQAIENNDSIKLTVQANGRNIVDATLDKKSFSAVGFGATVRWIGDQAGITMTFGAANNDVAVPSTNPNSPARGRPGGRRPGF